MRPHVASSGLAMACRLLFITLLAPGMALPVSAQPTAVQAGAALKAVDRANFTAPWRERLSALEQAYQRQVAPLLAPSTLATLSREDLGALFDAAYTMATYSNAERYFRDLDQVHAALAGHPPVDAQDTSRYFSALLQSRRFDEAASFAARHPDIVLEPVPTLLPSNLSRPTVYRVSGQGDALLALRPLLDGTRLVMVSHPLCPFSQRAEAVLATLPDLPAALRSRMLRLAPVGPSLHLDQLDRWNRQHADGEILLARRQSDWPMIDDWATPNFYLLQDGRVIDRFSGWPREGNEARLRQLLARFEACMAGACPAP